MIGAEAILEELYMIKVAKNWNQIAKQSVNQHTFESPPGQHPPINSTQLTEKLKFTEETSWKRKTKKIVMAGAEAG